MGRFGSSKLITSEFFYAKKENEMKLKTKKNVFTYLASLHCLLLPSDVFVAAATYLMVPENNVD